jgi:ParB-like chromosome segregation protein Spo0J
MPIIKEFVKNFPVSKIIPYDRNPRINKNAVNAVIKSIERTGNNDPIEVNKENIILCGHTRLSALKKMGIKTTDILIISGLTEEQQKEYRIRNNKTSEIAEWDFEMLEADFQEETLIEFGFDTENMYKGKGKIKKENLEPYKEFHILISYKPEHLKIMSEIIEKINQLKDNGVEVEQSSN